MRVLEISKENGEKRVISFDEAILRLQNYYGYDLEEELENKGIMQTSFYYFEIEKRSL